MLVYDFRRPSSFPVLFENYRIQLVFATYNYCTRIYLRSQPLTLPLCTLVESLSVLAIIREFLGKGG